MHSRRALVALAAVAAALVGLVAADLFWPRQPVRPRVRLLPEGVTAREIARVTWERPGEPLLVLERDEAGALALPGQAGAVDADVAAELLGTLEIASLGRRSGADASRALGLAPPRLVVRVTLRDGREVALELGAPVEALDRVWAARRAGGARRVDLLEGHLARALDRRADELRVRRVFAVPAGDIEAVDMRRGASSLTIVAGAMQVGQEHGLAPGRVRIDPARFAELAERLAALAMARFVDVDAPPASGLSVRARAGDRWLELVELGPCPGSEELRLVRATIGTGCVPADALDALVASIAAAEAWWARELLPGGLPEAMTVTDASGRVTRLERAGRAWKRATPDGARELDVDSGAVDTWLDDLAAASTGQHVAAGRVDRGAALVLAVDALYPGGRNERVTVWSHPELGLLGRRGDEPVYLRMGAQPFASRLLPVGPLRFSRRQLLAYEPYALREAVARQRDATIAHLARGQLLDEWNVRVPSRGTARAEVIDALRELTRLRALSLVAEEPAPSHGLRVPRRSIEIILDAGPLASASSPRHVLDIGAATPAGCLARLDAAGPVFELDARLCTILCGPWIE